MAAATDRRRDPRLRAVAWRDLTRLTPAETALELLLPLPWLAASLALAGAELYLPALAMSFVFFLAGLRIVHGAYHDALGLPRLATELVMFGFSLLMLGSMHAVQWNHLRHHGLCLAEGDVEALGARGSAWQALMLGPRFPLRLHRAALAGAPRRQRPWILAELAGNALWLPLLAAVSCGALRYHVAAMAIGQCLTAFFAVWTVHRGCDGTGIPARTIRNRQRSRLSLGMFLHLEHHLFPQVPTARLPILAQRLDAAFPERSWPLAW